MKQEGLTKQCKHREHSAKRNMIIFSIKTTSINFNLFWYFINWCDVLCGACCVVRFPGHSTQYSVQTVLLLWCVSWPRPLSGSSSVVSTLPTLQLEYKQHLPANQWTSTASNLKNIKITWTCLPPLHQFELVLIQQKLKKKDMEAILGGARWSLSI